MARSKTILQNQFPYHISARCINKEWFNLSMDRVWRIFCDELHMTHIVHNLQIHSFVLMNNHYHLIASTPDSNLSECMRRFSTRVSFRLTRMGNRINQTFAGRYFKSVLTQPNHYLNVYKYCYRNPVEAGLCEFAQDYKYSTLQGKLGNASLLVPILNDDSLFEDPEDCLRWVNTKATSEKTKAVQFGLKRKVFKSTKRPDHSLVLEDDELL